MRRGSGNVLPVTPTQVLRDKNGKLIRRTNWRRLLVSLVCTAMVMTVLFVWVLGAAFVKGDSMSPSFKNRDIVLFARMGSCRQHDVIILRLDRTLASDGVFASVRTKYVKRIIGMPGDTVDIDGGGRVCINGEVLEEPYTAGMTRKSDGAVAYPVTLGESEYFVLGDNREDSLDSRDFGPVKKSQISGKVIAVLRTEQRKNGEES